MNSIKLDEISELISSSSGIWYSNLTQDISFPSDGNESRQAVEERSFWYSHRNECIIDAMNILPPSGPVFDIGGGNGAVSIAIQKAGFDAVLLEPEMAGVKEAKRRGLSTVICSTFDAAKFSNGSIPAVGMFDILEHIEDDHGFLIKINKALIPKGTVYLTVPSFKFLWSESDDDAGHYRRYTKSELANLFESAGFKVLYASYFFSLLIPPIYLCRSLPYKYSIKRTDSNWRHGHHQNKRGAIGSSLLKSMRWEQHMIKKGKCIPFGSSCMLVAERL